LFSSSTSLISQATLFVQNPHSAKIPVLTNLSKKLGATAQVFYDQLTDVQLRAAEYVDVKNKSARQVVLMPFSLGACFLKMKNSSSSLFIFILCCYFY
jgi:hypothetical protein